MPTPVVTRHTAPDALPELLNIAEVAAYLGIGRSLAYALVARHELPSVRLGRLVRVPRAAFAELASGIAPARGGRR